MRSPSSPTPGSPTLIGVDKEVPGEVEEALDQLDSTDAATKPKLRGWLHTGMAPVMFLAGLALVATSPSLTSRIAAAVYLICALLLFGTSAVYHRGHWSASTNAIFRRWDHANIYLFIAGTYTPLAANGLSGQSRVLLLSVVWGCAAIGIAFRILWLQAPRWLYTALYILLGWAAVWWMADFWRAPGGPAAVILLVAGGLVYSGGAVVYALKRPNPSPTWFGFHEIFHACTVVAAICHYLAIVSITFS